LPISFKNQTIKTIKQGEKMKKVLLALLSAALLITVTQPAQAEDQKVLAIIDSAIESTKFASIIHEVCITSVQAVPSKMACPNGQSFMEGNGAAKAPWPASINNATYHGDSMVKAALAVNPNVKIVFVRYADVNSNGNSLNSPDVLVEAIKWVSNNADKHSIDAVSISQSSISTNNLSRCKTDTAAISAVSLLSSKNIPTFVATGNEGRKDIIGFPSCFSGVIPVAALANLEGFEKSSNVGVGVKLVSIGKVEATKFNGSPTTLYGTSTATVTAAASYLKNNTQKSFADYINGLTKVVVSGTSYPYSSR
jgi:hypothetical protein